MAEAYEEIEGSLADSLMAALVATDRADGDHRGKLAASIRMEKRGIDGDWLALDVDDSGDVVEELMRRYKAIEHPAKGVGAAKP
jgi:uncharacterized Ntn-hydrolase superfamily protein